ncbi:cell division protein FtsZ [Sphingomonas carotinifaciens]|uniref:Cell division protein FtsZ n=1 Tax=Sphingomonas carotinifaciens TaxID=1166323 RepID=A0A1G7J993_9SPHN|nr:cell division protein FtsZ [Sphingomonas carotinifaciens]MBB4084579.1 cell division protein FtsZ [Sphingomonas carotinifaciens]MWC43970.1 cell division protein FtsZ [Sphingomonas carotinifaciens]SDF21491.1 cell division protein FtsZ [Sphingomonas carotinifaciens]
MSIEFIAPEVDELTPRIAVIGVGGAGGNAIANMMRADVQGVDFLVANTDAQALKQSNAPNRIQLGAKITQGLGAGARPEIGRAAAEETIESLAKQLEGCHMVFIAAGMGGGTGTGAAPVIAKAARDMGILTVGVVTKPFAFEGNRRSKAADGGIEELQKFVDTLIVIPNQNLFLIANANTTFKEAFSMADEVLQQGVRGITDLMVMPGLINLDFADVRSVMQEMGKAMMGTGEAEGDNRALEAAQKAIANPLLDGVSMQGAKGVIISITGGDDMRLLEVDEAANHIRDLVDPDANIIWGSAFNPELEGRIRVSVVATGIDADVKAAPTPAPSEASRGFSFGMGRKTDETPSFRPSEPAAPAQAVQPLAPEQAPAAAAAVAPQAAPAPTPAAPAADKDELVLGSDTIVPQDAPAAPSAPAAPVAGEDPSRRRWLAPGGEGAADQAAAPAPRVKMGGTLFERMSNAARGAAQSDNGSAEPLDIPRFLHRQNNQ